MTKAEHSTYTSLTAHEYITYITLRKK